jgi:hypothetical protein
MLGLGVGAASINPATEQSPLSGLGIAGVIWLVITTIVAMFVGGWAAGRLSGVFRRGTGMLHGAVMWGFATLVALYFVTSAAGGLLSGAAGILNNIVSSSSQVAAQSPEATAQIREELRQRGIDIESLESQAQDPQARQEAEQRAREAGEKLAAGVATAGLFTFGLMLIGLAAALWGGATGVPREERIEAGPAERAA